MAIISPAILAEDKAGYAGQIRKVTGIAERVQIDLMDGDFAKPRSVELQDVWWPYNLLADIHLMYHKPMEYLHDLIMLKPSMVIVHAEVEVHHMHFAAELHKEGIKAGLAILPETPIENVEQIMHSFDHLLIFSGNLGQFGGKAELGLLDKVKAAKAHHPEIEIGWDGGVNLENAKTLAEGGVDVLNAGGAIQKAENPEQAYKKLVEAIE